MPKIANLITQYKKGSRDREVVKAYNKFHRDYYHRKKEEKKNQEIKKETKTEIE